MTVPVPRVSSPPAAPRSAESTVEANLGNLRQYLIHSRADRGPCPAFSQLKSDFLPTISRRAGVAERREHTRRCHVCDHRVRAWKGSWQFAGDRSLAWSRVAAHHARLHGGRVVRGLSRWIGKAAIASSGATRSTADDRRERQRKEAGKAGAPTPSRAAPAQSPSRESRRQPALPRQRGWRLSRGRREKLPPLVVLEEGPGLPPVATLANHVEARGGGLVFVPRIEEVLRDPDWRQVRTVVLAAPRPLGEWPGVLDRIEGGDRARRVYAILPRPHGGTSLPIHDDLRVLGGSLTEAGWERLLTDAGWARIDSEA